MQRYSNKYRRRSRKPKSEGRPVSPGLSPIANTFQFKMAKLSAARSNIGCLLFVCFLPMMILFFTGQLLDEFCGTQILDYCFYIGAIIFVVGSIIVLGSFFFSGAHKGSSWDGVVVKKEQKDENADRHDEKWTKYDYVYIRREDNGETEIIRERTGNIDSNSYDYFEVGDRVHHHSAIGFSYPYEKYDKTKDTYVICPFCGHKILIKYDYCDLCDNPVLK